MGFQTASSSTSSSSFHTKCILWQHHELMRSPLPGVHASPLEENILEWHGNFYFPDDHESFPGMVVHFILTLPPDFPNSTPDMQLLTSFPHSHVFGGSICFSLLREFEWHFEGLPGTAFWNPSRTVRSLLESVYVFLTVDEDQYRAVQRSEAEDVMKRAQTTCCHKCPHNPQSGHIWPLEEEWMAARTGESTNTTTTENQVCALAMHDDLTTQPQHAPKTEPIIAKLPAKAVVVSINSTTRVRVPRMNATFDQRIALLKVEADEIVSLAPLDQPSQNLDQETMEDFRCSVTGVRFDHSDKVVLGFGVDVQRRKDGSIESITTDLEPISMKIFVKGGIRKSALGSPMTHFFPFGINEVHWQRTKLVLRGCVDAILGQGPDSRALKTDEERLLFVVGELWKSMAVLMMKGEAHTSEKVLKGFCSLHHILLLAIDEPDPIRLVYRTAGIPATAAMAGTGRSPCVASLPLRATPLAPTNEKTVENPAETWAQVARRKRWVKAPQKELRRESSLRRTANQRVRAFVSKAEMRHKSKVPDFGRFLPLMLLSDVSWKEMQVPLVEELLTRNARWIVRAQTRLRSVQPWERKKMSDRVSQSWTASATGLKLTCFQIRFFLNVLPWARSALPTDLVASYERHHKPHLLVRAMYNALGGRPTPDMLENFQAESKKIESLTNFSDFFSMINMPRSNMNIQVMLCNAMVNSLRAGYHH